MKTAPIFGIAETRSSESCSQLTELLKISAEAEASVINLDKLQSLGAPSI